MNHIITGHLIIQIVNDFETIESIMQMNDLVTSSKSSLRGKNAIRTPAEINSESWSLAECHIL